MTPYKLGRSNGWPRGATRRTGKRPWCRSSSLVLAGLAVAISAGHARASERLFSYVYDTITLSPGAWEYEQYVTWKVAKENDRDYKSYQIRHE